MPQETKFKLPRNSDPAVSLYLDTSVIGGYFDPEFMNDTRALWKQMKNGSVRFVSSVVVANEVAKGPAHVRELMNATFAGSDLLQSSPAADQLAAAYLAEEVVPRRYAEDAFHVAICTMTRVDYLVSWNFKHLANVRREAGFNWVNGLQGYPLVRIVAPTFFLHVHKDSPL